MGIGRTWKHEREGSLPRRKQHKPFFHSGSFDEHVKQKHSSMVHHQAMELEGGRVLFVPEAVGSVEGKCEELIMRIREEQLKDEFLTASGSSSASKLLCVPGFSICKSGQMGQTRSRSQISTPSPPNHSQQRPSSSRICTSAFF